MTSIPIFDSISHPTIDSNWISPKYIGSSKIELLINEMIENNIMKSFAIGMKNIGSYDEKLYIQLIKPFEEFLIPIAYFDFNEGISLEGIKKQLQVIKSLGYKGIKLHPRFSNFSLENKKIIEVIQFANELNLIVLFCTYFYHNSQTACNNSIERLSNLLCKIEDCKIILLHSGTVKLLEMIEIGRSFKNVLLDLSFTICKYEGSSMDLDIKFACNTFDQRICIGSDFPEFTLKKLRERFEFFTKDLSVEKAENIGYKNILNYIK